MLHISIIKNDKQFELKHKIFNFSIYYTVLHYYSNQIKMKQENIGNIADTFMQYEEGSEKLRDIFLQPIHPENLKKITNKQIQAEFQLLSTVTFDQEKIFNMKNNKMNRYIDIFAYQHSRVKVQTIPNYYINANQVRSLVDRQIFAIFSQAPYKSFDSFWEAVYYKNVPLVVMLCSFNDPKRGKQSEQYWPNQGESASFSNNALKVKNIRCQANLNDKDFIINEFQIEGNQGVKRMKHIHWMGWSDLKRPVESNLNTFQQILETCLAHVEAKKLIWIHCSAGIGRTGTLAGIIQAIRLHKKNGKISIFQIVQNMRKYRYHAVQTQEQYRFLYQYLAKKLS